MNKKYEQERRDVGAHYADETRRRTPFVCSHCGEQTRATVCFQRVKLRFYSVDYDNIEDPQYMIFTEYEGGPDVTIPYHSIDYVRHWNCPVTNPSKGNQ